MKKWTRARYLPGVPLHNARERVTASPEHLELARRAGCEGMVLLKNQEQILPLEKGKKIAMFGKGIFDYVKGGGGSGDVSVSHVWNLYDGLVKRGAKEQIYDPLIRFYRENTAQQYQNGAVPGLVVEPEVPPKLLEEASIFTDTAVIVLSRFSGEGWDRKSVTYEGQDPYEISQSEQNSRVYGASDYYLSSRENAMVNAVCAAFAHVILVLNVGGLIESDWFAKNDRISSVLLAWQAGMEGGLAMADLLLGLENPSGKLPDTMAADLEDYPSTANFHESHHYVEYTEDIYVGYRYFETMAQAKDRVNYPFGFGLSYTRFQIKVLWARECDAELLFGIQVANTGNRAGKEVVQVYYSAPEGLLGKPARELAAFEKTKLLKPGECQNLILSFPRSVMASYDDLGKAAGSAWILEKGIYHFYVGNSVRDAKQVDFLLELESDEIMEQLTSKLSSSQLTKRMLSDGSYEVMPQTVPRDPMENGLGWSSEETEGRVPAVRYQPDYLLWPKEPDQRLKLDEVAEGKISLDKFMEQLSVEDLAELVGGQPNTGVANTFGFGNQPAYGIPNIMTADGPAGLRIEPQCGIYTTAWPCATLLASTWNPQIVEAVGRSAAEEVKENNISVWLAPGMNIHRNPLCGRNFEYYSEDPYLTGIIASAMVDGIQSQKVAATVKHFACNNKETNRKKSDSRVSERALREIYLKGFEICVKRSQPWALMTSYNRINAQQASESSELINGILRGEWGYEGLVTTDWWTKGEHYKEVKAGNDIKMGTGYPKRLLLALEKGLLSEEELKKCARKVLELILKVD